MTKVAKKIGMIGGLSWVSSAEYYRRLNEITKKRLGGVNSARLKLESVDRRTFVDAVIRDRNEASACAQILRAPQSIEMASASFIVMSCNEIHRFVTEIGPEIGIPFIHIAEATSRAIKEKGLTLVALLGVWKAMEEDFYPRILSQHGNKTLIPGEHEKS